MPASHIRMPVCILAALLPSRLPANAPGKAREAGPSVCARACCWETVTKPQFLVSAWTSPSHYGHLGCGPVGGTEQLVVRVPWPWPILLTPPSPFRVISQQPLRQRQLSTVRKLHHRGLGRRGPLGPWPLPLSSQRVCGTTAPGSWEPAHQVSRGIVEKEDTASPEPLPAVGRHSQR